MNGDCCGSGCGFCGRCDSAEPEDVCPYCETAGCDATCDAYYAELDRWLEGQSDAELIARADAFVAETAAPLFGAGDTEAA